MDKMMNQDTLKLIHATADTLNIALFGTDSPDAQRRYQITVRAILLLVDYNNPELDPDTAKRLDELKAFANKVI